MIVFWDQPIGLARFVVAARPPLQVLELIRYAPDGMTARERLSQAQAYCESRGYALETGAAADKLLTAYVARASYSAGPKLNFIRGSDGNKT